MGSLCENAWAEHNKTSYIYFVELPTHFPVLCSHTTSVHCSSPSALPVFCPTNVM